MHFKNGMFIYCIVYVYLYYNIIVTVYFSITSIMWIKLYFLCTAGSEDCCFQWSLPAKAATALVRLSHRNSVCLFVCLLHGWISQKRCKLGSSNLYHQLPGRLVSGTVKLLQKFEGVTPNEGTK